MRIVLCNLCQAPIRSVCEVSHLKTKLHKNRMEEKEKQRIKDIQVATELEIFNKECRRSGILPKKMESEKEGLDWYDNKNEVDCDTFKDDEEEALKEEAQELVPPAEDAKMACSSSESVHTDRIPDPPLTNESSPR